MSLSELPRASMVYRWLFTDSAGDGGYELPLIFSTCIFVVNVLEY